MLVQFGRHPDPRISACPLTILIYCVANSVSGLDVFDIAIVAEKVEYALRLLLIYLRSKIVCARTL
jgi:hypothetical protein